MGAVLWGDSVGFAEGRQGGMVCRQGWPVIVPANIVAAGLEECARACRPRVSARLLSTACRGSDMPVVIPPRCLQILQMYKDYIDPEFKWSNFTIEEQAKVIVAPRSNNLLETTRVRSWGALETGVCKGRDGVWTPRGCGPRVGGGCLDGSLSCPY